jgi:hypothetical protein
LILILKNNDKLKSMNRISTYLRLHCDFCGIIGHCVNNCRNPELNQIENELYLEKEQILMNPNIENCDYTIHLCAKINSIFGTNLSKLKAYAMIKCKYREPRQIRRQTQIEPDLHEYVANYVYHNDLPTNVRISHDYIPFDENDAVQYLIDLDEIPRIRTNIKNKNVKWVVVKENPSLSCNECPICYENFPSSKIAQLDCNHIFCITCTKKISKSNTNIMCALCRTPITCIKTFEAIL